ncbi:GntR family transcriptional regulator [Rhodobacteraceae bacterium RKSG542]|uniref:GntR family transcriptional regulator n=1 Tax=Pseudovibrio flavus TaxID=2529854 RepID=UPI0012BB930E|nr:GntR family transcriptional regulator [Pseudovibrio flavus]MTI15939.1 GntR family transcriptional regulator [Pseudovibrio flavus]
MSTIKAPTRLQQTAEALEQRILSGEFEPGQHLKEAQFVSEFSVSRGVIREAFKTLEQEDIVTILPHRGVFVREFSMQETLEMFDIRAHLSLLAIEAAATNLTMREIAELERMDEEMKQSLEAQDPCRAMQLNWDFHENIYSKCGNDLLISLINSLRKKQTLSCLLSFRVPSTTERANAEHSAIIKAIRAGDSVAAAQAMHDHIMGGKQRFIERVERMQALSRNGLDS